MPLARGQDGNWSLAFASEADRSTDEKSDLSYLEALPRYMTLFDPSFTRAKSRSEFFIYFLAACHPRIAGPGLESFCDVSRGYRRNVCASRKSGDIGSEAPSRTLVVRPRSPNSMFTGNTGRTGMFSSYRPPSSIMGCRAAFQSL
jgi:hypothetical protein